MGVFEALRSAAQEALKRWPIVVVYYLCNLAAAVVVVAPALMFISSVLGHSLESERLFSNFDVSWAAETIRNGGTPAGWTMASVAAITALLYLPLNTFLAGGAIALAIDGRQSFFGSGARYLPRFLRLLLCSLPCYGLLFLLNSALASLISKAGENSMQEYPWVILGWARVVLIVALFWLLNTTFDYAKVILIAEERFGALTAAFDAARLLWLQPQGVAIFFAGQIIGILFLLIYHGLSEASPQTSLLMVGVVFLVRQLYTLTRFWVRLWVWNAETLYYVSLRGKPLVLSTQYRMTGPPDSAYFVTMIAPQALPDGEDQPPV